MLFDMYSNSIYMVKRNSRVNASTEETLLKYEQLIAFFDQIIKCDNVRKRNLEVDKNLKALLQEMKEFVDKCSKIY